MGDAEGNGSRDAEGSESRDAETNGSRDAEGNATPDALPELEFLPRVVDAGHYEAQVGHEVDRALTRHERALEDARLARADAAIAAAEDALAALRRERAQPAKLQRARARLTQLHRERAAILARLDALGASADSPAGVAGAEVASVEGGKAQYTQASRADSADSVYLDTSASGQPGRDSPPDFSIAPLDAHGCIYASADEAASDSTTPLGDLRMPARIHAALLPYQREGAQWIAEHAIRATGGGILADEMGLGKTVQAVAALAMLHVSGRLAARPRVLVVAPATVLRQWRAEVVRWYPVLRARILHPSTGTTGEVDSADCDIGLDDVQESILPQDGPGDSPEVFITTYEQLGTRAAGKAILRTPYALVFLDEGHRVRNPETRAARLVRRLDAAARIVLSGTPVQNDLAELWALVDWAAPGRLGTLPVFRAEIAAPIAAGGYVHATSVQVQTAYRCAVHLRDLIAPHILRRLKADVLRGTGALPAKTEQVLFCGLTTHQRRLYTIYLGSPDVKAILNGDRNVLAGIDVLRKICNHPDLLFVRHRSAGADEESALDASTTALSAMRAASAAAQVSSLESGTTRPDAKHEWADSLLPDALSTVQRSGKLIVLMQLVTRWAAGGHRALVFCQTRQMLDIVEKVVCGCTALSGAYLRMDGTTPIGGRKALVDAFNAAESSAVLFLLTTRVGGLGLNLTGADRVVIFDPDWNPSTDAQARERAWRLGQTRPVAIFRLLTAGTIEEKIYHRQIFKQLLTSRVLDDPSQSARFLRSTDLYDLFTLDGNTHAADDMGLDTDGLVHDFGAGASHTESEKAAGIETSAAHGQTEEPAATRLQSVVLSNAPPDAHAIASGKRVLDDIVDVAGLHSALEHDRMLQRPRHEMAVVSREAQRRADAALAALRSSVGAAGSAASSGTAPRSGNTLPRGTALLGITGAAASSRLLAPRAEAFDDDATVRRLVSLFRAQDGGRAGRSNSRPVTSAAIAAAFAGLAGTEALAFRAVLRTVASFNRDSGTWILKPEYRRYL